MLHEHTHEKGFIGSGLCRSSGSSEAGVRSGASVVVLCVSVSEGVFASVGAGLCVQM